MQIPARHFELKPSLVNMVQKSQFCGDSHEDPHTHLRTFLQYCETIQHIEVPQDTIRLKLFPFSLDGAAREWYHTLEPDDTANWPELVMKFLNKFFPESKVVEYRHKISGFSMKDGESLYYAWERFKMLLKRCPQHGFRADEQVRIFYGGVSQY